MTVRMSRAIHDELIAHAIEERPNECCGLLAGRDDEIVRAYRATNREASPVRYEIDPSDLLRLFREIDDAGLEHVGIYHSHTHTPAYPSATDVRLAFYPDAYYVLVTLMDGVDHGVRAYQIRDSQVTEEPIERFD